MWVGVYRTGGGSGSRIHLITACVHVYAYTHPQKTTHKSSTQAPPTNHNPHNQNPAHLRRRLGRLGGLGRARLHLRKEELQLGVLLVLGLFCFCEIVGVVFIGMMLVWSVGVVVMTTTDLEGKEGHIYEPPR